LFWLQETREKKKEEEQGSRGKDEKLEERLWANKRARTRFENLWGGASYNKGKIEETFRKRS